MGILSWRRDDLLIGPALAGYFPVLIVLYAAAVALIKA